VYVEVQFLYVHVGRLQCSLSRAFPITDRKCDAAVALQTLMMTSGKDGLLRIHSTLMQ